MKIYIILFMLCSGLYAAHSQTYKNAFRTDVCDCLEEESLKRQLTENVFKACLRETLPKYAAQIDAEIVEEEINKKFYKGQLARKDLLVAMYTELIYTCDVYFKHINFKRNSKKLIAREIAKESELEKYDQMVALTPNAMAYFMRAKIHFNLGNIKETEADINKSLALNTNRENYKATRHELLLLAWVYEEQERYAEAIALYDKVYFGDLDSEVAQLRALADKKEGGNVSNIPKLGDVKVTNEINNTVIKETNTRTSEPQNRRGRATNKTTTKTHIKETKRTRKVEKQQDTSTLRKLLKLGND